MKKYDLAVIGAGPGGYIAAIRAAQLGFKVICVDKRAALGGTCLNVGCIPSKTLLQSSELYYHVKHQGKSLGLIFSELGFDFAQMMQRKEQVVASLVEGVALLFKKNQIDFLQGEAQFADLHQLIVTNNEKQKEIIEAEQIIIATGSEPIALPNCQFDGKQIISSTEALSLSSVPKRLAVVGGGVIGVELASVYNRLGSEVTIIEMQSAICPSMDAAISKQLLKSLQNQGIKFLLSTQLQSVTSQNDLITLTIKNDQQEKVLNADKILVAVGRKPYTNQLKLDKVSIATDEKGFIPVDSHFRTIQPHIFAIGDVIQGLMLAHRASQEGTVLVEWLKGEKTSIDYFTIPNVIYTYPEVAAVGMTEKDAEAANLTVQIGTAYFKGNPRARCMHETEGFIKIIGDKLTEKFLGMHVIGPHASELIAVGSLALQERVSMEGFAGLVFAHPTLGEAIKEALLMALKRPLHA